MKLNEDPIVVVRSSQSGVWIGTAVEMEGDSVRLTDAFRIWSWEGALDTTAIAANGVTGAKIGAMAPTVMVFGVCDVVWSCRQAYISLLPEPEPEPPPLPLPEPVTIPTSLMRAGSLSSSGDQGGQGYER